MFKKLQDVDYLSLFWWSIKVGSAVAGGYFTYIAHRVDTPMIIRLIDVFLVDAALLVFWQLVDKTERKALVNRMVYGIGLFIMFGVVVGIASGWVVSVEGAARVSLGLFVFRSLYAVFADYIEYRKQPSVIKSRQDRYKARLEAAAERAKVKADIAKTTRVELMKARASQWALLPGRKLWRELQAVQADEMRIELIGKRWPDDYVPSTNGNGHKQTSPKSIGILTVENCKACGVEFKYKHTTKRRLYCSDACRKQYARKHQSYLNGV